MSDSSHLPGQPSAENHSGPLPDSGENWLPGLRIWIRDLAISILFAAVVILFLYQPVKVEGTSMMPRLTDQERIFINKFIYRLEPVERGDVIVFRFPYDETKSYIKRVIGLPGDVVEIRDGEVYVDGVRTEEPYVLSEYRGRQSFGPAKVPENEYFVLGDHRNSSNDSRMWGTVARGYIYGKAQLIYWPVARWGLLE